MNKLKYLLIAILLFIPLSYPIYANNINYDIIKIELNFSKPEFDIKDDYIKINFNNSNGLLYHSKKPVIPFISRHYCMPLGTEIVEIDYNINQFKIINLSNKIIPSTDPLIPGFSKIGENKYKMDPKIYDSNDLYPENWFKIYSGGGLDKDGHSTFFNIRIFPIRYSPKSDKIYCIEHLELNITIKIPDENIISNNSIYDLIIISPNDFIDQLQPLINHKKNIGSNTYLKTTEEIYGEYNGFDEAEEIKLFIKDAIESWNAKYFLMVGGMKSLIFAEPRDNKNLGCNDWYFPVRYSNLRESGNIHDPGFISDLYYADIYDSTGSFSSWDTDNNGVFGEWSIFSGRRDIIDLYPDVYIGRLPCRNKNEVEIIVNKIINYETPKSNSWYDKIVLVAGDPFNDSKVGTNYYEGELIADKISSYMDDFEIIKLYSSNRYNNSDYTPLTVNILREISKGCGHLFFDGHGTPGYWTTGWPNAEPISNGGINVYDILSLSNNDKNPICIIGGCHTSQFNVSFLSTLFNYSYTWTYGMPIAECLSWHLTRKFNGGSIATIGNTGLGYEAEGEYGDRDGDGLNEPDCVEAWGGYLERCFYKSLNDNNIVLGEAWGNAIKKYLDIYPSMEDQWDTKVIEEWVLIGDPSLIIGGIVNDNKNDLW